MEPDDPRIWLIIEDLRRPGAARHAHTIAVTPKNDGIMAHLTISLPDNPAARGVDLGLDNIREAIRALFTLLPEAGARPPNCAPWSEREMALLTMLHEMEDASGDVCSIGAEEGHDPLLELRRVAATKRLERSRQRAATLNSRIVPQPN